jgi:aspartate/methionine/tyrosine aminotransferase
MKDTIKKTLIDYEVVQSKIKEYNLANVGRASIREILTLINAVEKETGEEFIRMEMGVPGLSACPIGIEAQLNALRKGAASKYPHIEGVPEFKQEVSRFIRLFLDADVPSRCCFPSTGSTNGSFISFLTISRLSPEKDTVLFLDPGFPVHRQQLRVLGIKTESIDVYNYRGAKLGDKVAEVLSSGNISSLLYSTPNNPSWICFTGEELKMIGSQCNKHDVVAIEDLAYFDMDFRRDYGTPGEPPYQPTVANYADKFILLISSSKIFSYAGERIGAIAVSEKLFDSSSENLVKSYSSSNFGHALVYGAAYAVSAGVNHSSQFALAAMLRAVNDGDYRFLDEIRVYGEKAKIMKKIFTDNGFRIVYDNDNGEPIADGFYFTVSYPGFTGEELVAELLFYGISAISLSNTGSTRREGIRACVSLVRVDQFPELERRLRMFHDNHVNLRE